MKVYIVQPMAGYPKDIIMRERERGIMAVKLYYPDAEILDNYFDDYDQKTPLENLARSVALMAQADMCLFLPMYVNHGYYGCEVEDHIAQVYCIPRFAINIMEDAIPFYNQEYPAKNLGGDQNGT